MVKRYSIRYKLKYVPSYYEGLSEQQEAEQKTVMDFKNGIYDEDVCQWFLHTISSKIHNFESEFVVCFIPSSGGDEKTRNRFNTLYEYLKEKLPSEVYINDIGYIGERTPTHIIGEDKDNNEIAISVDHFFGKSVILIDDVLTSGNTFESIADQLMDFGASNIYGWFLGRTVHPDLPISQAYLEKKKKMREEELTFEKYVQEHFSEDE